MPNNPITDPLAWRIVKAPSLADMELLAREVFTGLPAKFRALCEGLIIKIEDFAPDDVLDDLDIESEYDLMGLFQGVGLPFRSESAPVQLASRVLVRELCRPPAAASRPLARKGWDRLRGRGSRCQRWRSAR